MAVPSKLRLSRLRTGLTQIDLAKRVGVSAASVSLYESGRLVPPPETRRKITSALRETART